jgi:hypothetical protein
MLLKTIVFGLIVTFASTASAQQDQSQQDRSQTDTSTSPVPMPFDGKQGDSPNQGDQSDVERAKMLLMGYHGLPSKETFEENLDDPKVVVMSIALDEGGFSLHRKRALAALGYWADAGLMRIYNQLLQDAQAPDVLRHRVILLLAEHFPDEALGHLKPFLAHKDLQYRLSAIEAIRRLPSDEAVAALREALETETNAVAKKRLEKYTRVLR